jgi:hypothetical protein
MPWASVATATMMSFAVFANNAILVSELTILVAYGGASNP